MYKTILIAIVTFFITMHYSLAQESFKASILHDDIVREYFIYIPQSYSSESPAPLLFNFHGYGSNASEQMWYGDFRPIADTAGFILVHPEGTLLDGQAHWNVGGWTIGSTVDDVGFVSALIDTIASNYNINQKRIYATGMSNGGYMSFLLACQLSSRIAAIASVTGSMTPQTYNACNPSHPTPVLQIHGTSDQVVPYTGAVWSHSIQDVTSYWVDHNYCQSNPEMKEVPNIDDSDGSTVEQYIYTDGTKGSSVEHFKVIGGDHTWPGTAFSGPGTNQDMNASKEIWRFFSMYDIDGLILTSKPKEIAENKAAIYPNPAKNEFIIQLPESENTELIIYSIDGTEVYRKNINNGHHNHLVSSSDWAKGLYICKIMSNDQTWIKKVMVN